MMGLQLITALVIALLMTLFCLLVHGRQGRKGGLVWHFLVIFLATWAGGIWLRAFGPSLWGVHWLNFLMVGIVVTLIIEVYGSHRVPKGRHETLDLLENMGREKEMEEVAYVTLTVFLWVLVAVLAGLILIRYLFGPL
ncbi:MAG: hypothetical protein ACQEQ7_15505 [Thermodesulfobacteriota bacterium]